MSKVFIDTNILLYTRDSHESDKQIRSRDLLHEIASDGTGVISTQVIQEFYVASTKKLNADPIITRQLIKKLLNLEVVAVTIEIIDEAIGISMNNNISFCDSLIIAAALWAKCDSVLTEDLNHGQLIEGIKILNPFFE